MSYGNLRQNIGRYFSIHVNNYFVTRIVDAFLTLKSLILFNFQALARFQEVTNRYTQEKQSVSLHFLIPS